MGREKDITPPSVYYDSPRLPGPSELEDWSSLFISPDDAETIMFNAIANHRTLTPKQVEVLTKISLGQKDTDLLSELRKLESEEIDR